MAKVVYDGSFGDKRLDNKGNQFQRALFRNSVNSIQQIAESRAEQKSFYRFLHNSKTTEDLLIKETVNACAKSIQGRFVLAMQDTTEADFTAHSGRLLTDSGLGSLSYPKDIGFKLHPSLVVDAQTCYPLGFSDIKIWNRDPEINRERDSEYKKLPIEEKESYRWLESSINTKEALAGAAAVIIVQDREGDIFDQLAAIPDEKTFFLIRSQINRQTTTNEKLWTAIDKEEVAGTYEVKVEADLRRKTPSRVATVAVKYLSTEIRCPKNHIKKALRSKTVRLFVVEAKEADTEGVEEPIHWRLITTWPVNNFEDALGVIEWYTWRWLIEDVFKQLKKEGCNIEGSELESGWAIRKLCILMLDTIVKLLQMRIAYNCQEGENPEIGTVFTEQEQKCLHLLNRKMEGGTTKLQNPHPSSKLAWAVWIIARLGGWKGYKSQRRPGMATLQTGLNDFYKSYLIYELLHEQHPQKDVGTR